MSNLTAANFGFKLRLAMDVLERRGATDVGHQVVHSRKAKVKSTTKFITT
jgi:hypothetical protein